MKSVCEQVKMDGKNSRFSVSQRFDNREQDLPLKHYDVAVVGTGPAGLATANELLKHNVTNFALIGKPLRGKSNIPEFGGELAKYKIPANSKGQQVMFDIPNDSPLSPVNTRRSAKRLQRKKKAPNLKREAGPYYRDVGKAIRTLKPEDVYATEIHHTVWDGEKHTVYNVEGKPILTAEYVCFNLGAEERSLTEANPRFIPFESRIQSSLELIKGISTRKIKKELKKMPEENRHIVIVGSSHTAFTDAAILTQGTIQIGKFNRRNSHVVRLLEKILPKTIADFIPNQKLLIAYRDKGDIDEIIKVFAETADDAVKEGLEKGPSEAIDSKKICPVTKRYRRFIGFREWAKELYLAWKNGLEPKVDIVHLDEISDDILSNAIIFNAIGIKGKSLLVQDTEGIPYPLPIRYNTITAEESGKLPGIPNAYINGSNGNVLRPGEKTGGEPEYQYPDGTQRHLHFVDGYNEVAKIIVKDVRERRSQRVQILN